jgi:hypothetical protein
MADAFQSFLMHTSIHRRLDTLNAQFVLVSLLLPGLGCMQLELSMLFYMQAQCLDVMHISMIPMNKPQLPPSAGL